MADVGALVRDARARRGWTQAELAETVGVSRAWLVSIERGRHDRAEMGKVLRLLELVGVGMVGVDDRSVAVDTQAHNDGLDLDAFLSEIARRPT